MALDLESDGQRRMRMISKRVLSHFLYGKTKWRISDIANAVAEELAAEFPDAAFVCAEVNDPANTGACVRIEKSDES